MKVSLIALLLVTLPVAAQYSDRTWNIQRDATGAGWSGTDGRGGRVHIQRNAIGGWTVHERRSPRHYDHRGYDYDSRQRDRYRNYSR